MIEPTIKVPSRSKSRPNDPPISEAGSQTCDKRIHLRESFGKRARYSQPHDYATLLWRRNKHTGHKDTSHQHDDDSASSKCRSRESRRTNQEQRWRVCTQPHSLHNPALLIMRITSHAPRRVVMQSGANSRAGEIVLLSRPASGSLRGTTSEGAK